jgi:hypothetical protein
MKDKYRVVRRKATMNTIPPEQDIVEIVDQKGKRAVLMGRWTTLCLDEGSVNALDATDEQILRAWNTDEPVF